VLGHQVQKIKGEQNQYLIAKTGLRGGLGRPENQIDPGEKIIGLRVTLMLAGNL
jgi:hypothetical protein